MLLHSLSNKASDFCTFFFIEGQVEYRKMMQYGKRFAIGLEGERSLCDLPRNIIDIILELLPIHDAARTSILAQKWRYIWAMHPNLVLDKFSCKKLSNSRRSGLTDSIDKILLQHVGNIVKFVLDFSEVNLYSYPDINRWILFVIRKGVRELYLDVSNNVPYKIPSYLYTYQNLTHLNLFNCYIKPPNSIFYCPNLKVLYLKQITFAPMSSTKDHVLIKAPLLAYLSIIYCRGIEFLDIYTPKLYYLFVVDSHYLDLNSFMICTSLNVVSLSLCQDVISLRKDERGTLLKLIFGLPTLRTLYLDSFYLKFLSEDPDSRNLFAIHICLEDIMLALALSDLAQVSYTISFLQCFLNLQKLQIYIFDSNRLAEDVLNYLETPNNLIHPFLKLEEVVIRCFDGSKPEILLIKLLFAGTPSLVKMYIERDRSFSSREERRVTEELMSCPRASPQAELIYLPTRRP